MAGALYHVMPVLSSMPCRSSGKAKIIASMCVRNFATVSGFTGKFSRSACNYGSNSLRESVFMHWAYFIKTFYSLMS